MKKAKLNTRLAIAGALFSGILMLVAIVGFTTNEVANNDNNIEAVQLADNSMGDAVIFDGKCGGEEKSKDGEKAKKGEKKEGKCGDDKAKAKDGDKKEGKCGDDKAKSKDGDKKEGKCGDDKAKSKDGDKKEGKCGEGKCGEGKCGK
jgi:uncharacterized low-complexity protein